MPAPLPSCSSSLAVDSARRRKLVVSLLGKSLRLSVMIVIVLLGALLTATFRELFHERPALPTASTARGEATVDLPLLALLRPGGWELGDSSWTVAVVDLADPASAARLQSLGQPRSSGAELAPLEAKLLTWLRRSRPQVVESCRVYDFPARATRLRAVTEGQGSSERLRLIQVIWQQGNRPPQLFQATPVPSGTQRGTRDEHLLPLPLGATVLARRWEDSGTLSAEVIRCSTAWDETLRHWTKAGWSSRTLPTSDASVPFVLLRQGERKLHLCPLQDGSAGVPVVLLVTAELSSPSQGNP